MSSSAINVTERVSPRARMIVALASALVAGCAISSNEEETDPAPIDTSAQPLGTAPIVIGAPARWAPMQRGGAWWGNVSTPLVNQVWGDVLNPTPDREVTTAIRYRWACRLPRFGGQRQSLEVASAQFHVDDKLLGFIKGPPVDAELSFVFDPARYRTLLAPGIHEIRIRCIAAETTGPQVGERTGVSVSFPVRLYGGTAPSQESHGTNVLDNHAWYSEGNAYVYASVRNARAVYAKTLSGMTTLELHAGKAGSEFVVDHFMLKIDGIIPTVRFVDGAFWNRPAEFFGEKSVRQVEVDTRSLCNGRHVLAMHAHGIDVNPPNAGRQLASQVEIPFFTSNLGSVACPPG
jgi:hypothetical protein